MNIGWIGAGKMGLPICQRFKAAGHTIKVLARSNASAENLNLAGLAHTSTIADLCSNSQIVFSSITDDAALLDIANGVAANLAKGSIYIDISTVSPSASANVAAMLEKFGINYLRSPVSGSTMMAEAGTLTAIISGPKWVFDGSISIFEVFAKKSTHVGEGEEARYLKLVINSMVAATAALLGEALAFGNKGGLSNATMLDVISQSVVASPLINYKRDMIVDEYYKAAASLNMLKKDLEIFLSVGAANKMPLPVNSKIQEIYKEASAHGLGQNDFFILVQEAARKSGIN